MLFTLYSVYLTDMFLKLLFPINRHYTHYRMTLKWRKTFKIWYWLCDSMGRSLHNSAITIICCLDSIHFFHFGKKWKAQFYIQLLLVIQLYSHTRLSLKNGGGGGRRDIELDFCHLNALIMSGESWSYFSCSSSYIVKLIASNYFF